MKANTHICTECLAQCVPVSFTKGSIWMEVLLWVLVFPIGILYSLYRIATRKKVCPVCHSDRLVPLSSIRGQQLAQKA